MDFELSEEHKLVQKTVKEFVSKEVIPYASDWDINEILPYEDIKKKMGELGIFGICFPEKYSGSGMDYISLGLECEELEYGESTLRVIMSVHVGLNSCGLYVWGTEVQKQ